MSFKMKFGQFDTGAPLLESMTYRLLIKQNKRDQEIHGKDEKEKLQENRKTTK